MPDSRHVHGTGPNPGPTFLTLQGPGPLISCPVASNIRRLFWVFFVVFFCFSPPLACFGGGLLVVVVMAVSVSILLDCLELAL